MAASRRCYLTLRWLETSVVAVSEETKVYFSTGRRSPNCWYWTSRVFSSFNQHRFNTKKQEIYTTSD